MRIEHIAFQVEDPVATAAWYCEHLGLRVVRHVPEAADMHFLADDSGYGVLEIYRNPAAPIPDYRAQNPLILHVAFFSSAPAQDAERLVRAGGRIISQNTLPDGTELAMLQDPWGHAIQLCRRSKHLVPELAPR